MVNEIVVSNIQVGQHNANVQVAFDVSPEGLREILASANNLSETIWRIINELNDSPNRCTENGIAFATGEDAPFWQTPMRVVFEVPSR